MFAEVDMHKVVRNLLWLFCAIYAASIFVAHTAQEKALNNRSCDKPPIYTARGPVARRCFPSPADRPARVGGQAE